VSIRNVAVQGFTSGIVLNKVDNSVVSNVTLTNNHSGIYLGESKSNQIIGCSIVYNVEGISLGSNSNNNIISNNYVHTDQNLLKISNSQNNLVSSNIFSNSLWAVYIQYSTADDNASDTLPTGNFFFQNNFLNNSQQAFVLDVCSPNSTLTFPNFWSHNGQGNYFDDYLTKYPNASEIDLKGIGDAAYFLAVNNVDEYPLIEPVNIDILQTSPSTEQITLTLSPTPTPTQTGAILSETEQNAVSPIVIITVAIVAFVIIAVLSLSYFRRQH
jgi:parallel beta-helix repeat protein